VATSLTKDWSIFRVVAKGQEIGDRDLRVFHRDAVGDLDLEGFRLQGRIGQSLLDSILGPDDLRKQNDELVAAHPRHRVRVPHAGRQPPGRLLEHHVDGGSISVQPHRVYLPPPLRTKLVLSTSSSSVSLPEKER
jgi:hypothetical protein